MFFSRFRAELALSIILAAVSAQAAQTNFADQTMGSGTHFSISSGAFQNFVTGSKFQIDGSSIGANQILYSDGSQNIAKAPISSLGRSVIAAADPAAERSLIGAEPALGNPSVNGYVLSSTILGVRSWIAQGSLVNDASTTVKGVVKLSVAPAVSSNPIAVGDNDARVTADQVAGTASIRTLGTGAQQATAGNDSRLNDQRTPLDLSVTDAKVATSAAIAWSKINKTGALAGDVGASPVLTFNAPLSKSVNTISIAKSDAAHDGYLAQGDFSLFNAKPNDSAVVHNTGNETVGGVKTFTSLPILPTQSMNTVLAGPSTGGATAPTFRALAQADIPTLDWSKITIPSVTNAIFVSQANGLDSNSGTVLGGPKLTLGNAKAAATSGQTVVVLDGSFNERNLGKDGIAYFFFPNAGVNYSGSAAGGIFDDSSSGTNGAVTLTVGGFGTFVSTGTGGNANSVVEESNSGSNIVLTGKYAKAVNVSGGVATTLDLINGSFIGHVNQIDVQGNSLFATAVHWRFGESKIFADEINALASTSPQYTFCLWTDPSSAPTGQLYIQAARIKNFETGNGQHRAIYVTGDPAQRVWIFSNQIIGPNCNDGRAIDDNGGFLYVDTQKILGTVGSISPSVLYVNSQKISPQPASNNSLLNIADRAYINIAEYDDVGTPAGQALINVTSTAEVHLSNASINRTVNGDAIVTGNGTLYLNGSVISTQTGYYDINNSGNFATVYVGSTKYDLTKTAGRILLADPVLTDHSAVIGPVLANPGTPNVFQNNVPTGSSTVSYQVVARAADGTTTAVSSTGSIATAPTTWALPKSFIVIWNPVPGAVSYDVYRSAAPIATGKIATTTSFIQNDYGTTFTPTGSVPTAGNTTGGVKVRAAASFLPIDTPPAPSSGFRLFSSLSSVATIEDTSGNFNAVVLNNDSRLTNSRTANAIQTLTSKLIDNTADPTNGQVFAFNGVKWAPTTLSGGGTVDNTAFASTWSGSTGIAPSRNAVYNELHLFDTNDNGKVDVLDVASALVKTDVSGNVSAAAAGVDYLNANQAITLTGDVAGTGSTAIVTTISPGAVSDDKASLSVKPSVGLVSDSNLTLSGSQTIDSVSTTVGTLVLCTNQTTSSQNGFWIVQAGAWTRPTWYATGSVTQAQQFMTTFARGGAVYGGTIWNCTTSLVITIGTTATTWSKVTLQTGALANTTVTAASYGAANKSPTFTVNAQGRLTAAADVTITPAAIGAEVPLTFSTGLTRSTNTVTVNTSQNISQLSNLTTNGFVKTGSGNGTLSIDTNTYLTGNQSITIGGDGSGTGTTSITLTLLKATGVTGQIEYSKGAAVASANNLALGTDGNVFHISGTTQVNLLSSTGWQAGSQVTLIFDGALTVKHSQTVSGANKPILLLGAVDRATAANTVLQLTYDGTSWFETNSGLGTVALSSKTLPAGTIVGDSDTQTFTGKTFDSQATGNVLKKLEYYHVARPDGGDGTNATEVTTAGPTYGHYTFSNSVAKASNYVIYRAPVPDDLDTATDLAARFKFRLGGADTGKHSYYISMADCANSASCDNPTFSNEVALSFAGDASGASADEEEVGYTTLTSWKSSLTAGHVLVIKLARDGSDGTLDTSTVNSTDLMLSIRYGSSQ